MNEQRIEEQPYDDRHNAPAVLRNPVADGEHIGNDHQEQLIDAGADGHTSFFRPAYGSDGQHIGEEINHPHAQRPEFPGRTTTEYFDRARAQMPSRVPGQGLLHPHVAEHGVPAFGTGLNWLASVQSPIRADLVNFDFGHVGGLGGFDVSNIELRTIYAHLLETAGRVRAEMRERGMQVDI